MYIETYGINQNNFVIIYTRTIFFQIIGHLVYYQFINAAIVAPDAFEIIASSHKNPLTNDQRRNLASIAKILQFSASKKGVCIAFVNYFFYMKYYFLFVS